jgi:hypothetical protein
MSATSPAFSVNAFQHGAGPAVSYYQSTSQSLPTGVFTVVNFQTKEFDTDNAFNTFSMIFQPKVAGIYQVNAAVYSVTFSAAEAVTAIFKNGVVYKRGVDLNGASVMSQFNTTVASLVALNGGSDYIDIRISQATGAGITTSVGISLTYFNAAWIRGL